MIKRILLTLVILATISVATAQSFRYGVRAGASYARELTSNKDDQSKHKPKYDLTVGIFGEKFFGEKFSLSAELLYAGKGSVTEIHDPLATKPHTARWNFVYLDIPIMANFYVVDFLAIKAGVQAGIPLGGYSYSKGSRHWFGKSGIDNPSFEFAVPVALSFQITRNIFIDVRYTHGFTNVMSTMRPKDVAKKTTNSVFTLSAGWKF